MRCGPPRRQPEFRARRARERVDFRAALSQALRVSSGALESGPRPGALRRSALALAALALLAHGGNLLYRAHAHGCDSPLLLCPTERGAWATGDYASYAAVADDIRARGLLRASYYQRTPGYPWLLHASRAVTGEVSPLRWLGPLGAALAAGAGSALAARASGQLAAGVLAGLLIALWPLGFRFSAALRPDGLHAFLAVAALAATFAWHRRARARDAALAALLWSLVQSLRPSFFPVAAALLPLLWRPLREPQRRAAALAVAGGTLCVPLFVVASNLAQHGAAVPTQVGSTNLACYAVPRLQQELGQGSFHALRRDCEARFDALPKSRRAAAQNAHALAFFRAHPAATLRSFARELASQLGEPQSPSRHRALYPDWLRLGRGASWAFWALAAAGLLALVRRERALAGSLALLFGLVMLPAASSHLVGPRLRLPVDFLLAPAVAVALAGGARWLAQRLARAKHSQPSA